MMAQPMKNLELRYPMIQFLIKTIIKAVEPMNRKKKLQEHESTTLYLLC